MLVNSFDIDQDFFKVNKELSFIPEFVNLKKKWKHDKVSWSNLLWAIALIYDYDSKHFNMPLDVRIELIEIEFLECKDFFSDNFEAIEPLALRYEKLQEDSEKRFLKEWNNKVDEISLFLKNWTITDDNIKEQMDILLKQEKLMEQKDKIMERIAKKEKGTKIVGRDRLSLLEEEDD